MREAGAPPLLGQTLGSFRAMDRLGSGATSRVYEAKQTYPSRRVALKVLFGSSSDTKTDDQRFEMEAEVLGRLQHENIAQIYEWGIHGVEHEGRTIPVRFLAMELVRQPLSLVDYCQQRALSLGRRVELLLAACRAVQHGHGRGVLHRDLKPDHLLVDGRGQLKLIDFGIARLLDQPSRELTKAGELLGTPRYMSPEQRVDPTAADVRSDLYSLGIIAREVLETGGERLPAELAWVIARATAPRPRERYPNVHALANDLQRVQQRRPVLARPRSAWYLVRTRARRHWKPLVAAAAMTLTLLGSSLWLHASAQSVTRRILAVTESIRRMLPAIVRLESTPGTYHARLRMLRQLATGESLRFHPRTPQTLNIDILTCWAKTLHEGGNLEKAAQALESAAEWQSEQGDRAMTTSCAALALARAELELDLGHPEATDQWSRCVLDALQPLLPDLTLAERAILVKAQIYLADGYRTSGELEASHRQLETAAALSGSEEDAPTSLQLVDQGQFRILESRAQLARHKGDILAWNQWSESCLQMAQRLIRSTPNHNLHREFLARAKVHRGLALGASGDALGADRTLKEAQTDFDTLARDNPHNPKYRALYCWACCARGERFEQLGDGESALEQYQQVHGLGTLCGDIGSSALARSVIRQSEAAIQRLSP